MLSRELFSWAYSASALSFFATIVNFIIAFFSKNKDTALKHYKVGAMCFFGFLLLFMVGFGACMAGI